MISLEENKRRRNEISIVPLINVVFLLLIFFMITGTVSKPEENIELPTSYTASDISKDIPHIITITPTGILFNQSPIRASELKESLSPLLRNKQAPSPIIIQADPELSAELLVNILRLITGYGISDVLIATEPYQEEGQ